MDNAAGVRIALDGAAAERVEMDRGRDELHDDVGGEFTFDDARAAACASAALLQVGDSQAALWHTHQTYALHMSGTAPTSNAILSGVSVDGAAALILEGNLRGAETYLRPVLELTPDPDNTSLGGRLRHVGGLLHSKTADVEHARELAGNIRAWLAGQDCKPA